MSTFLVGSSSNSRNEELRRVSQVDGAVESRPQRVPSDLDHDYDLLHDIDKHKDIYRLKVIYSYFIFSYFKHIYTRYKIQYKLLTISPCS